MARLLALSPPAEFTHSIMGQATSIFETYLRYSSCGPVDVQEVDARRRWLVTALAESEAPPNMQCMDTLRCGAGARVVTTSIVLVPSGPCHDPVVRADVRLPRPHLKSTRPESATAICS